MASTVLRTNVFCMWCINNGFIPESNQQCNGVLKQHKFLTHLVEKLESGDPKDVMESIEKVRLALVHSSNLVLYFAGNLEVLRPPTLNVINSFLPPEQSEHKNQKGWVICLNTT